MNDKNSIFNTDWNHDGRVDRNDRMFYNDFIINSDYNRSNTCYKKNNDNKTSSNNGNDVVAITILLAWVITLHACNYIIEKNSIYDQGKIIILVLIALVCCILEFIFIRRFFKNK